MPTSAADALSFCQSLHQSLAARLADSDAVRATVETLRHQNSYRESCFCKGLVLPVVDALTTQFLRDRYAASRNDAHRALRCEGFNTPLYTCDASQVGFSSHSRSNSYHPGDKAGRQPKSRRSPDFCIRFGSTFRLVGEVKFHPDLRTAHVSRVARELRDYLSVTTEPTSDWGHDVGYGLVYGFAGSLRRTAVAIMDFWESDRVFLTRMGTA